MSRIIIGLAVLFLIVVGGIVLLTSSKPQVSYHDATSPVKYFYGENCFYCKQQKPILEKLAGEGFRVNVIEVFQNTQLAQQFEIRGTPTFVGKNSDKLIGLQEENTLRQWLLQNNAKLS